MALEPAAELAEGEQLLVRDRAGRLEERVDERRGVALGEDQVVVRRVVGVRRSRSAGTCRGGRPSGRRPTSRTSGGPSPRPPPRGPSRRAAAAPAPASVRGRVMAADPTQGGAGSMQPGVACHHSAHGRRHRLQPAQGVRGRRPLRRRLASSSSGATGWPSPGPNGAGKTTLLRMLTGETSDRGRRARHREGHAGRAPRPATAARPRPQRSASTSSRAPPTSSRPSGSWQRLEQAMAAGRRPTRRRSPSTRARRPASSTRAATRWRDHAGARRARPRLPRRRPRPAALDLLRRGAHARLARPRPRRRPRPAPPRRADEPPRRRQPRVARARARLARRRVHRSSRTTAGSSRR